MKDKIVFHGHVTIIKMALKLGFNCDSLQFQNLLQKKERVKPNVYKLILQIFLK